MIASLTQRQRIHPHKLLMWIAICSICMMFAGWTSAVMVRKAQGNWLHFQLPLAFSISTAVILLSSVSMYFTVKAFKKRQFSTYKSLITITALAGVLFVLLQAYGFYQMTQSGITLESNGEGVSGSFVYVIAGVHIAHVLGGVIALLITFLKARFQKKVKVYSSTGLEVLATYWHFVDALWIYLFL
ncbi:MAG TPA: cytochrome c oxidase subunit 3, partial [Chitinophagaceae bacterium]|nr:cytochrome c oxidase subunit 3 [Chitinophagaceae bacterium]